MTTKQLEILQHSVGVDQYGQGRMYRNHFCAGERDATDCRELVAQGLMWNWEREGLPYYNCSVTDAGKAAIREHSPKPPLLTRSQQRYRRFLDADSGYSFIEWLRNCDRAKEQA